MRSVLENDLLEFSCTCEDRGERPELELSFNQSEKGHRKQIRCYFLFKIIIIISEVHVRQSKNMNLYVEENVHNWKVTDHYES